MSLLYGNAVFNYMNGCHAEALEACGQRPLRSSFDGAQDDTLFSTNASQHLYIQLNPFAYFINIHKFISGM